VKLDFFIELKIESLALPQVDQSAIQFFPRSHNGLRQCALPGKSRSQDFEIAFLPDEGQLGPPV